MAIGIKLDVFEGPFDLLCHLLDENQVDIYDIPIAEITRQYLAYLDSLRRYDLEIASEFLVLAATLLAIKSKMLLPRAALEEKEVLSPEGEEDPRNALVRQILEYKRYKEAAESFCLLEEESRLCHSRPNEPEMYKALFDEKSLWRKMEPEGLKAAMDGVLARLGKEAHVHLVARENITVQDQMDLISSRLAEAPEGMRFQDIFEGIASKLRLIIIFLALLEMIFMKKILILQNKNYGDILVFPYNAVRRA